MQFKRNVLVVFGTRPEAIKMCPVVNELKKRNNINTVVCVTGQHKHMLKQILREFEIEPDYDLDVMKENQTLFDITTEIINRIKTVLKKTEPDVVLVHGDTTTAFTTALACYYLKIPVGHVEAGLRTNNIYSPFPEEFNRQAISLISQYHFAPTEQAKLNLINEGKDASSIYVTGNTVIDALQTTVKDNYYNSILDWSLKNSSGMDSKMILITAHRRENIGEPMVHMFRAIRRILDENKEIKAVYPIHMNPKVREIAYDILGEHERIKMIEPLDVMDFHNFLARSYIVLTDSGGVQEEAPSLGVPVLVMRNTTERPEGVKAGTLKLVGTDEENIYNEFKKLIENKEEYDRMAKANNPYGDGKASIRIANILERI